MRTVIYLNKWSDLFHLMLLKVDGQRSRLLDSRFTHSLEQARKLVEYWKTEYDVASIGVHDHSDMDLDDFFDSMDVDLSSEVEEKLW